MHDMTGESGNRLLKVGRKPSRLPLARLMRNIIRYRVLLLMMAPATILLILVKYLPMFGVIIAFKNMNYADGILGSEWIGLKNFEFLFNSTDAWIITRNTVLYNAVFIVTTMFTAVSFAIALNELRNRFLAKLFQSAMFFPFFLSAVVISYLVYSFLGHENGFLNKVVFGTLDIPPIQWYNEPHYWPFILPLVNLWKGVGYSMIIYLAAIIGIDEEYYEAAVIDGASKWKQIRYITLPLIRPVIIIMFLLAVGYIFNADFGLFYQVTLNSGPIYDTTNVIDTYVYRAMMTLGDFGMSSAAGLFQSSVGFLLVLGANALVRRINKDEALF